MCAGWSHPCFLNLCKLSCCKEGSILPQSWHMQGSPTAAFGEASDIGICASMEVVLDNMPCMSRMNLRWSCLIYSAHCAIWYPWYSSPRVVTTRRAWTTACIKERVLPLPKIMPQEHYDVHGLLFLKTRTVLGVSKLMLGPWGYGQIKNLYQK